MIGNFILIFAISLLVSTIATAVIISLCRKYSIFDYPTQRKRHKVPTPILGGTGILVAIWAGIGFSLYYNGDSLAEIKDTIPNILAGSLIIYLIGLWDDFRPLSAWIKLSGQILAGLILFYGGLSIDLISLPAYGSFDVNGFSVIITVLWVVALSNAINLIDGLDGLAAGVSAIAALSMTVIGLIYSIESIVIISLTLSGALLAFWVFNRYPAKIFMGDSGSLLVGYFFAVISLVVPIKSFTTAALFLPLVILGVPLTETLTSIFRRLAAGKNVMKADRRHIYHYLSYAGLSEKQVVVLFYVLGTIFGIISVAMSLYSRVLVLTILLLFMVVIFIIYFIFISRMRKGLRKDNF
ncbi:MAG: MraY family glycosyltransferase [Candidatus Zixiibacteriota bacterium]